MTGTGMSINLEGATEAISTIFGQLADDKSIWSYAIAAAVTMTDVYKRQDEYRRQITNWEIDQYLYKI